MITTSRTATGASSLPTAPTVIFALLGLIDIALLGVVGSAIAPPLAVSIIIAVLGLVTLVALIPARHGSRRALVTAIVARVISALLAAAAFFAGAPGCREPDHGPHPLHPGRRGPRTHLGGRLARLHDAAGWPDLDLHVQRHVRDHPPTGTPGLLGWADTIAALAAIPCAHRRPAAARILRACSPDSTLLPWAWPCPRWSGATPCPAVAPFGFGAWPVSSLPAPSSLRLRHPSPTRTSALPHHTAPGPPRWPRRCSWRSPWPAPYQCARLIPFWHRANPGRPARIKVWLAPIVPCLVVASSYDPLWTR